MRTPTSYLLFLDESGTHDMVHVDEQYPVFVLMGLLVGEKYYQKTLAPRVKKLKSDFGLDKSTVLHSRDIRKQQGAFTFLHDQGLRESFYTRINGLFNSRFRLYAVGIDKAALARKYLVPLNPYDISMSQLLSTVCGGPGDPGVNRPNVTRIMAESRGKMEDKALQAEFQRLKRAGLPNYGAEGVSSRFPTTVSRQFPSRVHFPPKRHAMAGLELADLAAYPVGRAMVNRTWDNDAFLAMKPRMKSLVVFP